MVKMLGLPPTEVASGLRMLLFSSESSREAAIPMLEISNTLHTSASTHHGSPFRSAVRTGRPSNEKVVRDGVEGGW
jgi:hypothetical protein